MINNYYLIFKPHPEMSIRKNICTIQNSRVSNSGIVTSCRLNQKGQTLAVCDRKGDVSFYKKNSGSSVEFLGEFSTFQSHNQSLQNTQNIISSQWLGGDDNSPSFLTTNGQSLKIWKINNLSIGQQSQFSDPVLRKNRNQNLLDLNTSLKAQFFIQCSTINLNLKKDLVITQNGDSISITDIEYCKTILETTPSKITKPPSAPRYAGETKMDYQQRIQTQNQYWDFIDTVTNAKFQGVHSNRFGYSDKAGQLNFVDSRVTQSAEPSIKCGIPRPNTLVQGCLNVLSDFQFLENQYQIITRDFLYIYKWDLRNPNAYTMRRSVYPSINSQICQFYEQCQIYNRFKLICNSWGSKIITTNFQESFHEFEIGVQSNMRYINQNEVCVGKLVNNLDLDIPALYQTKTLKCLDFNQNSDVICSSYGSQIKLFSF